MKVSVVMPVRNEGREVDVTLDSMFAQTRLPDEIIVADGCSTDDTVARVMRYADAAVPVRVVRNDSVFRAGGLNLGSRVASGDLIIPMDFGNRADPRWLESLVKPFEEDPALDYLGGVWFPILEGSFQRVCAAVVYCQDTLAMTMDRAKLDEVLAKANHALPSGGCVAYRRALWERSGGFCEWARKGQDQLFGRRVRKLGGKIGFTLDAVIRHHMLDSPRALYDRFFHYGLWGSRTGLPRHRFRRVAMIYGVGLALAAAAILVPWLLIPLAVGFAAYLYLGAWRKLGIVAAATGTRFGLSDRWTAVVVLVVRDVAILLGNIRGTVDHLINPRWRRQTATYLDKGL